MVKNAKWDRDDGYFVPRDCYNSYFYLPDDPKTDVLEKFRLHGERNSRFCDGGSALHCNLDEHLSKKQYAFLLRYAIKQKTPYFTFNIPNTVCSAVVKTLIMPPVSSGISLASANGLLNARRKQSEDTTQNAKR